MKACPATLIDRVFARLPLFDGLSSGAVERLSTAGLGRGLLTAALRARLRKAGFVDMSRLAMATPDELTSVRKIGPMRLSAIRAHILDELARFEADARVRHGEEATARRRIERLRALPAGRLPFRLDHVEGFGRARAAPAPRIEELDDVATILVRLMLADQPRHPFPGSTPDDDVVESDDQARNWAELLRARDREWDEADPTRPGHAGDPY